VFRRIWCAYEVCHSSQGAWRRRARREARRCSAASTACTPLWKARGRQSVFQRGSCRVTRAPSRTGVGAQGPRRTGKRRFLESSCAWGRHLDISMHRQVGGSRASAQHSYGRTRGVAVPRTGNARRSAHTIPLRQPGGGRTYCRRGRISHSSRRQLGHAPPAPGEHGHHGRAPAAHPRRRVVACAGQG